MVQLLTALEQVRLSTVPPCLRACTPMEYCAIAQDLRASSDMRQVVAEVTDLSS